MKKALVLLALSLAMLSASADSRRVDYAGYRIGSSDVMTDQTRISGLSCFVNDSGQQTSQELTASQVPGQKVTSWWSYSGTSNVPATQTTPAYIQYDGSNTVAGSTYSFVWTYDTAEYSPAYVVVDYDYIKYNLSYDANGGSYAPSTVNNIVYINEVTVATGDMVTRTGYTWSGWTNDLSATVWTGGERVTGESLGLNSIYDGADVVLRAKWTPHTYTVNFNKNTTDSVSGTMAPMSLTYGEPANLMPNAFARSGWRFGGWATMPGMDAGKVYEDGQSVVNLTSDNGGIVVLYAVWEPKNFAIRYHRNDGSGVTLVDSSCLSGTPVKMPSQTPWVGYSFRGWATTADGDVEYEEGKDYSIDPGDADVIHLYAVWSPIKYSIAFDANGGAGTMEGTSVEYGEVYTVPDCAFVKLGFEFKGWATNATGGVVFSSGESALDLTTTADGAITFYAVWSEPRYVAFDGNGAHNEEAMAEDVMSFEGIETRPLVPNKFEKAGYTFGGWATNAAAAANFVVAYADNADVISTNLWMGVGETNVLYAVWQTNTYTVVFNPNGGKGGLAYQEFVYDQPQPLQAREKCGFGSDLAFVGWATNSTGDVVYHDEDTVSDLTSEANGTIMLYAKWGSGSLSEAMDCENLSWVQDNSASPGNWGECTEEGYNGSESSVCAIVPGDQNGSHVMKTLSTSSGAGWLSFWYKMSSIESTECWLALNDGDSSKVIYPTNTWTQYGPIEIKNIKKVDLTFSLSDHSPDDIYKVWIDQMKWEPMDEVSLANDGWNEGTFNTLPADSSPSNVFADVAGKVDCVVYGGQSWGESGGRLTSLVAGVKYWVHTTSKVSWTVEGASVPAVEDDVYGPFGRSKAIPEEVRSLKPTVYDVSLTFGGEPAEAGDCVAAYCGADTNVLCGLGKAYDSGSGVKCDLVLYAGEGTNIHFRAWRWRSSTPATVDGVRDADTVCDITAPAPGTIDATTLPVTVPSRKFTVTFDGNGGTGAMEVQDFAEEEEKSLATNAFTKAGCLFVGWKDRSGMEYADGATIVAACDLTLAAQWKKTAKPPTAATGLLYSGRAQKGTDWGAGYVIADNIATNAGSYVATATVRDGYIWEDGTTDAKQIQWSIDKATYDMSGVVFEDGTFTADGEPKSLVVSGNLPAGVKVAYEGNGQTDAGSYTVTAKFTGDEVNYKPIADIMTATLIITGGVNPGPDNPDSGDSGSGDSGSGDSGSNPDDPMRGTSQLHPDGVAAIGTFTAGFAATYNGWLKDGTGAIRALLAVKTTKAKAGQATKSTITVMPVGGKKYTRKTSFIPGANSTDEYGIVYGVHGLLGTFDGYVVEASADVYKSKDPAAKALASKIPVAVHTFAFDTDSGFAVFSASVAKTGKTKVQGYLGSGAKVSVSTTGVLGEDYFAVPVAVSKKAMEFGFVLWIPLNGDKPFVANIFNSAWKAAQTGGAYALADGVHVFDFVELPTFRSYIAAVDGTPVAPVGEKFTVSGSKWAFSKTSGKLKVVDGILAVISKSEPANLSGLKLSYAAKTGLVKGSFKLYYMEGGKVKFDKVTITGAVVDGVFMGNCTVKKLGSFAVWAE